MKRKWFGFVFSSFCLSLFLTQVLWAQGVALTPTEKKDEWWAKRHAANVEQMSKGDTELLMIGDSITHGWEGKGRKVWNSYYAHRKPINLGFSADRTEHVLWRLDNLPLDKITPKAAVIMIGTNNVGHKSSSPREAAEGVKAIVEKLEKQYPSMKILVLNVFPRDNKPDGGMRKKVDEINSFLPDLLKDKPNVTLLSINDQFLDAEGNLPKEIMADMLHPGEFGYELWAKTMEPTLSKLLGEGNPAKKPGHRMEGSNTWWKDRHNANVEQMSKGEAEFLMIGDSITHGWEGHKGLVEKYFGEFKPINLGFSGDQTQHVLWRLDNLPMDKINPKIAMIMIGTNNIGNKANTPWMIADGIAAIVDKLQEKFPKMQIVVLEVFPRSEKPDDQGRHRVEEINLALKGMFDGKENVEIVDVGGIFLNEDGTLPKDLMPDFLHLNAKGYEMWGEKIAPVLKEKYAK